MAVMPVASAVRWRTGPLRLVRFSVVLPGRDGEVPGVGAAWGQGDEGEQPGGERQPGGQAQGVVQPVVEGGVGGADDLLDDLAEAGVGGGVLRDLAGLDGVDD